VNSKPGSATLRRGEPDLCGRSAAKPDLSRPAGAGEATPETRNRRRRQIRPSADFGTGKPAPNPRDAHGPAFAGEANRRQGGPMVRDLLARRVQCTRSHEYNCLLPESTRKRSNRRMKPPRCFAPLLAMGFLVPLHVAAVDLRDDDALPPAPPGRFYAPPLPKDPSAPPTASSILSPPPLFPDLVEEASRSDEPSQPSPSAHRSQPSQTGPSREGRSVYPPDRFSRTPPRAQAGASGRRLQKLQRKLGLRPDQMAMIKPILQRAGRQLKALRQDPGLAPPERRYYARQIFASSFHQIRPLLTASQLRKWRQLRQERRAAVARA